MAVSSSAAVGLISEETNEDLQKLMTDLDFVDGENVLRKFQSQQCQEMTESSPFMLLENNNKLQEMVTILENKVARLEKQSLEKLKADMIEENCEQDNEVLMSHFSDHPKTETGWAKKNLFKEIYEDFDHKLNERENALKIKLFGKIEKRTRELTALNEEKLEKFTKMLKEDMLKEMNSKFLSEMLRNKLEMQGVKMKIFESLKGQSLSTRFCDGLLERARTDFYWRITGYKELLKKWEREGKGEILSSVFFVKDCGLEMITKLKYENPSWLGIYVCFVPPKASKPQHPSIYFHRTTFILLDQSQGNAEERNVVRIAEPRYGKADAQKCMEDFSGRNKFASIGLLNSSPAYVVNDAILVEVLIEPLSILWKYFASSDGSHFWRIDNYFKKKRDCQEGVIRYLYSDYFYSGEKGFRMQLILDLDFDGEARIFLHFRSGEWDSVLPGRFYHRTTVMILDQTDSKTKNHLILSKDSDSTAEDFMGRIPHSEIEVPTYLKDDCLLVQITVEPVM